MEPTTKHRFFARCLRCLTVFAWESESRRAPGTNETPSCPCGSRAEFMGRCARNPMPPAADEVPCDSRCTAARGPNCDCSCGGRNHGKDVLAMIEAGGAVFEISAAAKRRADEYSDALQVIDGRLRELDAKREKDLSHIEKFQRYRLLSARHKAARARAHNARMKLLRSVLEQ